MRVRFSPWTFLLSWLVPAPPWYGEWSGSISLGSFLEERWSNGKMARSLFWAQEKRVRFPYVPRISTTAATTSPFPRTFILLLWLVPAPLSYGGWGDSISFGSFRDCGPTARHHVRIMVTRVRLPSIPWGGCIHSSPASCAEASHA